MLMRYMLSLMCWVSCALCMEEGIRHKGGYAEGNHTKNSFLELQLATHKGMVLAGIFYGPLAHKKHLKDEFLRLALEHHMIDSCRTKVGWLKHLLKRQEERTIDEQSFVKMAESFKEEADARNMIEGKVAVSMYEAKQQAHKVRYFMFSNNEEGPNDERRYKKCEIRESILAKYLYVSESVDYKSSIVLTVGGLDQERHQTYEQAIANDNDPYNLAKEIVGILASCQSKPVAALCINLNHEDWYEGH